MTDYNTYTVTRPADHCPLFWSQAAAAQLVVVVGPFIRDTDTGSIDCLFAYGYQNGNPGGVPNPQSVFARILPSEALGDFLKAIIDGEVAPQPQSIDNAYPEDWWADWTSQLSTADRSKSPIAYSVDIPQPPSPPTGPKAASLAAVIFGAHGTANPAAFGPTESVTRHPYAESVVS